MGLMFCVGIILGMQLGFDAPSMSLTGRGVSDIQATESQAQDAGTESESFVVEKPQKLKKKKVSVYDVARSAGALNKETAGMISDLAKLNECAGDCVSEIFEGPLAKAKQTVLSALHEDIMDLVEHVKKERQYLKKKFDEIALVKKGSI